MFYYLKQTKTKVIMKENQFIKLKDENAEPFYVNVNNITHICKNGQQALVYVVGQAKGILTQESLEDIRNMLPSALGYENI